MPTIIDFGGSGAKKQTETYTFPSGDTGGTKDLGDDNAVRYVNAENVYNAGRAVTKTATCRAYMVSSGDCWIYGPSGNFIIGVPAWNKEHDYYFNVSV